jgi:hypothetical protein
MSYYGCTIEDEFTGEAIQERPGTCPATGCWYYTPKDGTTETLGKVMPKQCCMCKCFGELPGNPPPRPPKEQL